MLRPCPVPWPQVQWQPQAAETEHGVPEAGDYVVKTRKAQSGTVLGGRGDWQVRVLWPTVTNLKESEENELSLLFLTKTSGPAFPFERGGPESLQVCAGRGINVTQGKGELANRIDWRRLARGEQLRGNDGLAEDRPGGETKANDTRSMMRTSWPAHNDREPRPCHIQVTSLQQVRRCRNLPQCKCQPAFTKVQAQPGQLRSGLKSPWPRLTRG